MKTLFLLIGVFGAIAAIGAPSDLMTIENGQQFFRDHQATFEAMARDVKLCRGIQRIDPIERPTFSQQKCQGGANTIPTRIANQLHDLGILWSLVSWGTYGQAKWDPNQFFSVTFVLQSEGLLTHGSGSQIAYFEQALGPVAIKNGWLPLNESPAHWAFQSSSH